MSIQRVPSVPFAQIANAALRDRRLSFKARGILALVLSNVGEWDATTNWIESQSDHDGKTAVQTAVTELTDLGYRRVTKERLPNGHLRTITEWFHEPSDRQIIRRPDYPAVGLSDGRETGASIEDHLPEDHLPEDQTDLTLMDLGGSQTAPNGLEAEAPPRTPGKAVSPGRSPYGAAFGRFWEIYPRKVGKREAWKVWQQIISDASAEEIIAGAVRYRDDPNREPQYTAHPSTWLRAGRWDDDPLPTRSGKQTAGQGKMRSYQEIYDRLNRTDREIES